MWIRAFSNLYMLHSPKFYIYTILMIVFMYSGNAYFGDELFRSICVHEDKVGRVIQIVNALGTCLFVWGICFGYSIVHRAFFRMS